MKKLTHVQLAESISAKLGTTYRLRLDGIVVYISFRQSMRYIIADVQVGNNTRTFSYFDDMIVESQVRNTHYVNKVYMTNIIGMLISKLEASS